MARYPWHLGKFHLKPMGLRECVLRIALRTPTDFLGVNAREDGLLHTVSEWRKGKGCTPEQWDELVQLIQGPR